MNLIKKIQNFWEIFYALPWCVPTWGIAEALVTVRCVLSGSIIHGNFEQQLVDAVRKKIGVSYVLSVNRGTTAIYLALVSLGLSKDDEVLTSSYVCWSVVQGILSAGCKPVFADIGSDLMVTETTINASITSSTKAIIIPHLSGSAAPIEKIEAIAKNRGIPLIDDAAQSFGVRRKGRFVGTFGQCGIYSCGPGKVLSGCGGAVLVTNDKKLFEKACTVSLLSRTESAVDVCKRLLSFWVWRRFRWVSLPFQILLNRVFKAAEKESPLFGQISNIDAGITLQQVLHHDDICNKYWSCYKYVSSIIKKIGGNVSVLRPLQQDDIPIKITCITASEIGAQNLITLLHNMGIEASRGYTPCHLQLHEAAVNLVETDRLWNRIVWVPVFNPNMKRLIKRVQK